MSTPKSYGRKSRDTQGSESSAPGSRRLQLASEEEEPLDLSTNTPDEVPVDLRTNRMSPEAGTPRGRRRENRGHYIENIILRPERPKGPVQNALQPWDIGFKTAQDPEPRVFNPPRGGSFAYIDHFNRIHNAPEAAPMIEAAPLVYEHVTGLSENRGHLDFSHITFFHYGDPLACLLSCGLNMAPSRPERPPPGDEPLYESEFADFADYEGGEESE